MFKFIFYTIYIVIGVYFTKYGFISMILYFLGCLSFAFYKLYTDKKKENNMNINKIEQEIMNLIMKYGENHDSALECGSEYISQNDEAQVDALELVYDIFDVICKYNEN